MEADARRVTCKDHGVVGHAGPWARREMGHARAFDEQVSWLATKTSLTAVHRTDASGVEDARADHRTVWDGTEDLLDWFAGLTRVNGPQARAGFLTSDYFRAAQSRPVRSRRMAKCMYMNGFSDPTRRRARHRPMDAHRPLA